MKKYDYIGTFVEDFAKVELNGKYGFINQKGEEIIPLKYDWAYNFKESFSIVRLNGKYGFINQKGEEIIPLKYDLLDDFKEGFARVKLNSKYGFINQEGEEVISLKYDWVSSFKEGFATVKLNSKHGFINRDHKEYFFIEGKKLGSENRNLYYQKYKDTIVFSTGCFIGDKDRFIKAIKETHNDNDYAKEYLAYIEEIEKELLA